MFSSPAKGTSASASGGPSIRTPSGWNAASARRTARAEPGPWWRTPSRSGSVATAGRSGEVPPALALSDDRLQILLPDHLVRHRVLDDRAEDARGHVAGPQHPVAEVGGEGHAVGDH